MPRGRRAEALARCVSSPRAHVIYNPYPNDAHHSTGRLSIAGKPAKMLHFDYESAEATVATLSKKKATRLTSG